MMAQVLRKMADLSLCRSHSASLCAFQINPFLKTYTPHFSGNSKTARFNYIKPMKSLSVPCSTCEQAMIKMHTDTRTYIYRHKHVYRHVHIQTCICMCMYTHTHVYKDVQRHMYACTHLYRGTHVYADTRIYTQTHVCMYALRHTCI